MSPFPGGRHPRRADLVAQPPSPVAAPATTAACRAQRALQATVLALICALALPVFAAADAREAQAFAALMHRSADAGPMAHAVVDKRQALIIVYTADGQEAGRSPVLLGAQRGDSSQPGVGERTQRGTLRPEDLTTPAGRFIAQPGRNRDGEAVIWVDPEAAFAIHRLRPGRSQAERQRRLAADNPSGRRVSAGCIVVPVAFFERVVQPVLGQGRSVVYVLPEAGSAL